MAKLIVEMPDELHAKLKRHAAADRKTLKVIVISLVDQYLRRPPTTVSGTSTGLCGAWKEPRSAEEIVSDIRSSRRWRTRQLP